MIGPGAVRCGLYRSVLIDFVDSGTVGLAPDEALAHLERCEACEAALTDTTLLIVGLRRLGREAARHAPPADAWTQLAARIERSRRAARRATWAWRMRLSGTFVGALAAALVVLSPAPAGRPPAAGPEPPNAVELEERRVEAAYLETVAIWAAVPDHRANSRPAPDGAQVQYPDGIKPDWKEVHRQTIDWWPQPAS